MVDFTSQDFTDRISRATLAAEEAGLAAVVITPGHDLAYLCGYEALPLERLTALVLAPGIPARLIVPALEVAAAEASPAGKLGLNLTTWEETQNPYQLLAAALPAAGRVAVDDLMAARHVFALRDALQDAQLLLAGPVISELRIRKTAQEVAALRAAGAAIDSVHAQVAELLRAGRTEREVGARIAELIIESGHEQVDFVIVASGPNSASPHHEVSDRVLQRGDPVVVDIGGTMGSGYCSDSTRTYSIGAPPKEFSDAFEVLVQAQSAAVSFARPGVSCEAVDAAARDVLTAAGLGEAFMHRTGHGIGLETHEEPYIVSGNTRILDAGMAFSIEPGFYLPGRFGARIEDIVVCEGDGIINCNNRPRELIITEG